MLHGIPKLRVQLNLTEQESGTVAKVTTDNSVPWGAVLLVHVRPHGDLTDTEQNNGLGR